MEQLDRAAFVTAVLHAYRATPDTLGHIRPSDRRLARQLFDSNVPLEIITAALALAATRRAARPTDAQPLEPIRSLYYFQPVIAELLKHYPQDTAFLAFIHDRYQRLLQGAWPPPPPKPTQHASGVDDDDSSRS